MADREISTETVAAAERLAAVEFTPAERAQMLGKLDEQVGRARARRAFEPANGLGPAVVFDPRLPGVALAPNDGGFQPSKQKPPPLPARDEDIAFAPVTALGGWLRRGEITSTRLTGIYLERLERIGARLGDGQGTIDHGERIGHALRRGNQPDHRRKRYLRD